MGGAPAARGCWIANGRRLLWGVLPLRGLLDLESEDAASGGAPVARGCSMEEEKMLFVGGAPAARGCWIANGRRLLLWELPLRGAAR